MSVCKPGYVAISIPGRRTTCVIKPQLPKKVIIIFDLPIQENDVFMFTPWKGKNALEDRAQGKKTSDKSALEKIDDTHVKMTFHVDKGANGYRLVQMRGGKPRNRIFKYVAPTELVAAESVPTIRFKQFYPLTMTPPSTNDPILRSKPANPSNLKVQEPKVDE